jgi:hypothetical protein
MTGRVNYLDMDAWSSVTMFNKILVGYIDGWQ